MTIEKGNTKQLRKRLDDLWVSGDDGIGADYQDTPDLELWSRYQWVADLTEREMAMVRGEIAAPAGRAVLVAEGESLLAAPSEEVK